MFDAENRARWYALRTRSRHEKHVRDWLANQGIERLLPTLGRISQWKDRKKVIELPLFPGYCFAQFFWQDRLAVLKVPGVVQIVGSGTSPEPIPDEEIDALKKLMDSTLAYDAHPYLQEGMAVKVIRGPLEGVRGVLLRKERRYRLVISVHLIKQSAAVEIDAAGVMPI
ncbi:MAG: UpxY family transcription antiterminator [Nitrospirota bacterium]|nr:UpxY family transcription antiterminator [Nitrospirota bacterium]